MSRFSDVNDPDGSNERSPDRTSAHGTMPEKAPGEKKSQGQTNRQKDEYIGFYTNGRRKERFKSACKAHNRSMTQAFERFMDFYVTNWESSRDPLFALERAGEDA